MPRRHYNHLTKSLRRSRTRRKLPGSWKVPGMPSTWNILEVQLPHVDFTCWWSAQVLRLLHLLFHKFQGRFDGLIHISGKLGSAWIIPWSILDQWFITWNIPISSSEILWNCRLNVEKWPRKPLHLGDGRQWDPRRVGWLYRCTILESNLIFTPWKINMEPTNQPFGKENDLPNLHDYVPC